MEVTSYSIEFSIQNRELKHQARNDVKDPRKLVSHRTKVMDMLDSSNSVRSLLSVLMKRSNEADDP